MVMLVDSREQNGKNKHILGWFDANGIQYVRKVTLETGDYMALDNKTVTVDRKAGLQEVYSNLVHDHDRFRRECERARAAGVQLYILIEEPAIHSVDDVASWKNPRIAEYYRIKKAHEEGRMMYRKISTVPPMTSARLQKQMQTMSEKYGVAWRFTTPQRCGADIVALVESEAHK